MFTITISDCYSLESSYTVVSHLPPSSQCACNNKLGVGTRITWLIIISSVQCGAYLYVWGMRHVLYTTYTLALYFRMGALSVESVCSTPQVCHVYFCTVQKWNSQLLWIEQFCALSYPLPLHVVSWFVSHSLDESPFGVEDTGTNKTDETYLYMW